MTHKELIALGADYSPSFEFNGETMPALYTLTLEHIEAVAAHESEVCAKICDKWSGSLSSIPAREIRARATTPKETT